MKTLISILFLIIGLAANAQPPTKFYCTYGGSGYDVGYDVKQTLDGGYIITGSTSSYGMGNTDMYLLKIDSMGQKVFQTTFGGVSNEIGKSVVQLLDSSYVMAGYTSSSGVGGYDVFLVKTDKAGNLIWQKTIGGADWDFANSMNATTDGGFIIAGTTYSYGHGNADGYVIKTDANGDTTWTKTFGGANDDEFKSVIQTSDGNYALTGYTKSYNDVDSGDVWVYKLNTIGDSLWCKFFGGTKEDFGNEIMQHPNGSFNIVGGTQSLGLGKLDAYTFKIDNIGNLLWFGVDGVANNNETFNSLAFSKKDPNISAYAESEIFSGFGLQVKIFELSPANLYYNATEYGGVYADEIFKIISTKDKGYACVGYTYSYGAYQSNIFFLKIDSNLVGSQSIVSVNEIEPDNVQLSVYPNPTSNELNINMNIKMIVDKLKLYNISGQEISISRRVISNQYNKITLNLEDLESGIYFLKYFDRVVKILLFHQ